jgi:predicted aspartyl protease
MQISAEALHGIPGDTTLSVLVHIGGTQAVALIDTGSTNTFLDSKFASKTNLTVHTTAAHKVLVAGGGELISAGHIPDCQFKIHKTAFTHTCKLLPLKGYDMVLGANWLKAHSPNYYDWENRTISITVQGKWCTLQDTTVPTTQHIISALACSKLLENGAQAYLLRLDTPAMAEQANYTQLHALEQNFVEHTVCAQSNHVLIGLRHLENT